MTQQSAPKAEMSRAIDALQDVPFRELPIIDRSELELFTICPFRAMQRAAGDVKLVGDAAESGEQVHQAFGAAVQAHIDAWPYGTTKDISRELFRMAFESRPDLQPDVIAAIRPSAWEFCKRLSRINPLNILAYDGGEDDKSGQLSVDFPAARVTSEIDFLFTNPHTPTVLHEWDYKSGRKKITATDVLESFQFQLHPVLVFANYPEVEQLEITIWCTRLGYRTAPVVFHRKDDAQYRARVQMALQAMHEAEMAVGGFLSLADYLAATVGDSFRTTPALECWPSLDKCVTCECATFCPAVDRVVKESADPKELLTALIAGEAKVAALKKFLTAHVDKTGEITLDDGTAFGRNKPKTDRKAPASIYKTGDDDEA